MAFSSRKLDRFIHAREKLAKRQRSLTLELAEATRDLFHSVFILDEDAPADVSDLLLMKLDSYQHGSAVEHQEEIDGRKLTVVRKVLQSCNPDQSLMDVMDYRDFSFGSKDYILSTNAGLLALSLAGGSLPEVLLHETMVRGPIGANHRVAQELGDDLDDITGVGARFCGTHGELWFELEE